MNNLHERALLLSRQHRRTEAELVSVLRDIERLTLHRTLGFSSLFAYAVSALGLSEPNYANKGVARNKIKNMPRNTRRNSRRAINRRTLFAQNGKYVNGERSFWRACDTSSTLVTRRDAHLSTSRDIVVAMTAGCERPSVRVATEPMN